MCAQSFLRRLAIWYENASSKIESLRKRGRKRTAPQYAYEDNQLAPEDAADLQYWVLEMNSEEGGVTLAKLRKRFLDEKNIKVRYHVIRKALMRLGYGGSAKKLVRITRVITN